MIEIAWGALAVGGFIVYNMLALHFVSRILSRASTDKRLYFLIALFNGMIVALSYHFFSAPFASYLFFIPIFCLEFRLISKSNWQQILFGAMAFVLNISAVQLLVFAAGSTILKISMDAFVESTLHFSQGMFFTFLILCSLLQAFQRFIPLEKVRKVSRAKVYSELISVMAFLLTLYICSDALIMFYEEIYPNMLLLTLSTLLLAFVIYYCLFLFSVSLVHLHIYKRKSDAAKDIAEKLGDKKAEVEEKLYTDSLTQLYNRKYVFMELEALLQEEETKFGVLFADLAALKYVNDVHGHAAGDRYLKRVAQAIKRSVRDDDVPARIGGDEFFVLVKDVSEDQLDTVISRIHTNIQTQNELEEFVVYANIGKVYVGNHSPKPSHSELIEQVDALMREDKKRFYEAVKT